MPSDFLANSPQQVYAIGERKPNHTKRALCALGKDRHILKGRNGQPIPIDPAFDTRWGFPINQFTSDCSVKDCSVHTMAGEYI